MPQRDPTSTGYGAGPGEFIALMAMTMALQAMCIDAMLPALDEIARDLSVSDPNQRQLVVGVFLFSAGFGSLLPGFLADRYGRRTVLAATAMGIAAFSGFAPQLLDGGPVGELIFMISGFILLGLSFGLVQLGDLATYGAMVILMVASALLVRMTYTARDLFVTRILSDRELAASTRTVKLLLNAYEESGADWLFELDRDGRLSGVNQRFAAAAGGSAAALDVVAKAMRKGSRAKCTKRRSGTRNATNP